jgi:hypothetical protein
VDVDPPGGAMEQPWLASADVDGDGKPELLLPQKNFCAPSCWNRRRRLPARRTARLEVFRVKDQINGSASDSRIIGAAAVVNGTNAVPSLFLFDAEHKQLTLCERDTNGVWQVVKNIELPVTTFQFGHQAPCRSAALRAWRSPGRIPWRGCRSAATCGKLTRLDDYDTPIKDGYLNDVIAGDLTGSGRKQLDLHGDGEKLSRPGELQRGTSWCPGDRWQVFEQHTFRGAHNALPEPRECARGRRDRRRQERPHRAGARPDSGLSAGMKARGL